MDAGYCQGPRSSTTLFNPAFSIKAARGIRVPASRVFDDALCRGEAAMAELNFKSACELIALIRKRELKPSEAVAHPLPRAAALNAQLNAFRSSRPAPPIPT